MHSKSLANNWKLPRQASQNQTSQSSPSSSHDGEGNSSVGGSMLKSAEGSMLKSAEGPSVKFASYLRILGAAAVIGSGVIYMLQGLHSVDIDLRNWVYIALMLALGAGGIFSFKLTQDRKGARVFFGLAALAIPIQFSQLGGMVFSYYGGGTGNLAEVFHFSAYPLSMLLGAGIPGIILAIIVSYAVFSILCQAHAKSLTPAFICLNLIMLTPVRTFPEGLLLVGLLAGIVFLNATIINLLVTCIMGTGVCIWGIKKRAKLLTSAGFIISFLGFVGLISMSIIQINMNAWLALAIVGVLFVALSSVLEKYGRRWYVSGKENFVTFTNW